MKKKKTLTGGFCTCKGCPASSLGLGCLFFRLCSSHQTSKLLNAVLSIIFLLKSFFRICLSSAVTRSITLFIVG